TEDKTSRTESKALDNELSALLTQAAKKQVKDVMEETTIDLVEMLNTTEEVLAKYDWGTSNDSRTKATGDRTHESDRPRTFRIARRSPYQGSRETCSERS